MKNMLLRRLRCVPRLKQPVVALSFLVAGLAATAPSPAAEPTNPNANYLGMNVNGLGDYQGDHAFVDIMNHARNWQNYAWTANATVDSDYWPTQDCSTVIWNTLGSDAELGTYTLKFYGQATLAALFTSAGFAVTGQSYNAATNETTATINLTSIVTRGLKFLNTKRTAASAVNTGVSNVRLYRPGYPTDGSVVFTSRYLALMSKFQVIRFMNWDNTNSSPVVSWSQRRKYNQANPSSSVTINGHTGSIGFVLERYIQLCNATNADMWLNLPVCADDDFITKTAQTIKYGSDGSNPYTSPQASPVFPPLNPGLKVYVEYGNEIWNSAAHFMCFRWIKEITDALVGAPITHPIEFDGQADPTTLIARYAAWRSVGASNLFRGVFGDAAMMTRVRPVLMGQLGGNWLNPRELPWIEDFYSVYRPGTDPFPNTTPHPVSRFFYGAGGSGYYGVNNKSTDPNTFFAPGNIPPSTWASQNAKDAVRSKNYGLKRIAYEGGMSLDVLDTLSATDAQKAALNADPRMQDATEDCHDIWSQNGGDLLVYFQATGGVDWEFTPDVGTLNSPKLLAIDNIRDVNPRAALTLGTPAPGTAIVSDVQATMALDTRGSIGYTTTSSGVTVLGGFEVGEWMAFPVNASVAGGYDLNMSVAGTGNFNVLVTVNGSPIGTVPVVGAGLGTLVTSGTLRIPLDKGLNAIRIQTTSVSMRVRSFTTTLATPITLNPVADKSTQGTNGTSMTITCSLYSLALMKFDLSGVNTVTSAKLRFYKHDTHTDPAGYTVFVGASDSWTEASGVTTATGAAVASLPTATAPAQWIELDVTSAIVAEPDDVITLAIQGPSSQWIGLSAREDTAFSPQLVIQP